jgi:ribonucleoside-diphosphate reductase beta chain
MVGNSSENKLIANDELSHVAFTTALIRTMPEDDPEFAEIQHEMEGETTELFMEVVEDEKTFSKFLFKDGDVIGLNHKIMCSKIDHLGAKRMRGIRKVYPLPFPKLDPTPWMSSWLNEGDQQPAPQETEKTSYVVNIQNSISDNSFDEFDL